MQTRKNGWIIKMKKIVYTLFNTKINVGALKSSTKFYTSLVWLGIFWEWNEKWFIRCVNAFDGF